MKRLVAVLAVTGVLLSPALVTLVRAEGTAGEKPAGEKAVGEKHHTPPVLVDMTCTGKITKEEKPGKDGKTWTHYVLTDAAGTRVMLSGPGRHTEEKAPAVNLEEYVDKNVTVTGKGFSSERDGKKWTRMVQITKIEVVEPAPAAK